MIAILDKLVSIETLLNVIKLERIERTVNEIRSEVNENEQ